jgi:hypothetical protein
MLPSAGKGNRPVIVTRYAGGKHLLQKARTIAYASPLTVG